MTQPPVDSPASTGRYIATPFVLADGSACDLILDANGNLRTNEPILLPKQLVTSDPLNPNGAPIVVASGTLSASLVGPVVDVHNLSGAAFQFTLTGSAGNLAVTGTVGIQGSIDGKNWVPITDTITAGTTVTVMGNTSVILNSTFTNVAMFRPVYVHTQGTGSLEEWVSGQR